MKDEKEPMVSVIIPVYNVGAFLPQCLESLMHQTLSYIEILCVDDASTDHSAQVVRDCQEQDSRIQLLQQSHQGVSAARNLGMRHARGKYIAFMDGDDWAEADMLKKMLDRAEQTASDVVVCSSQVHFGSHGICGVRRRRALQAALSAEDHLWVHDGTSGSVWRSMEAPGSWPFVWNKLIRRDVVEENGIDFSSTLSLGEDGVFLQLLFQYVKKVAFLPDKLYHYRYQREDSATERLFQKKATRFEQHIEVVAVLLREFSERHLLHENGSHLLRWILNFVYCDFLNLPTSDRKRYSAILGDLFMQYDLLSFRTQQNPIENRRLKKMLEGDETCTEVEKMLDILQMKAENRWMRLFLRE